MKTGITVVVLCVLVGAGGTYYVKHLSTDPPANFRTTAVELGTLTPTIKATGTVEAEEIVDIGAQVNGLITDFGPDPNDLEKDPKKRKKVDYNTVVHAGGVLAYIDDKVYKAQYDQAAAALEHAKADLKQCEAKTDQALHDWKRSQRLRPDLAGGGKAAVPAGKIATLDYRALSDSDYDLAEANYKVAEANVDLAKATIQQCEAALKMAKTNLDYTIVKSPVECTVVMRRVNIGQTVVSGINAASLFLIAKDLKRIQVWAQVNETDIGAIHEGMPVEFTVDTYRDDVFHGKVIQVRLNAQNTQNVVTYPVVIEADNKDLRLKPYMTATVKFLREQRNNVLMVPTQALRWKPRAPQVAPDARQALRDSGKGGPKPPAGKENPAAAKPAADVTAAKPVKEQDRGRVWIVDGNYVRPINVQIGINDETRTEVSGSELKEGMSVVIGETVAQDNSDDTKNPFAPQLFKGGQKKTEK
jgi:HlyD family secretion protein